MSAEMHCWGCRMHCLVRWITALRWIESSFSAWISRNMTLSSLCGACQHAFHAWGCTHEYTRIFTKRFQFRNVTDLQTFQHLYRELCTSGSFYDSRRDRGIDRYRKIHAEVAVEEVVLSSVKVNVSTSSSGIGRSLGMSYFVVKSHTWNVCR